MKNATEFGNKVKKAIADMAKKLNPSKHPEALEPLDVFVLAVLRQNSPVEKAVAGLELLKREFIDYNELRVAPPRDIVELLDESVPERRQKAMEITGGLNKIFDHGNTLDFAHVEEFGKRELRTHLAEALGFNSYVEAYMMLYVFDARAIPVDQLLVDRLKEDKLVHADSDIEDVRSMLERIIGAKEAMDEFGLLSTYEHTEVEKKSAKKAVKKTAKKSAKKAAKKTAKKTAEKSDSDSDKTKTAKKAKKTAKKAKSAKKAAKKTAKKTTKKSSKKS